MALGRRKGKQESLWVAGKDLPRTVRRLAPGRRPNLNQPGGGLRGRVKPVHGRMLAFRLRRKLAPNPLNPEPRAISMA